MKKIFLAIFLSSLIAFPLISLAGEYKSDGTTVHYEGLVPCGKSQPGPGEDELVTMPCQFCHLFVMIDGIVDFILFKIIPPTAVLMLVIGGLMFIFGSGSPTIVSRGRAILTSVVIGLVIIFAAWLIVNVLFRALNLSDFGLGLTGPDKWSQIECTIELPE
jgi:hypothetical protein